MPPCRRRITSRATEVPINQTSDPFFAFARAFGLMAETMTLAQRGEASARLRALGGNATHRAYFAGLADLLDEYTDEARAVAP